ncbi:MAG TPA: acyl-CoA dehydrogenase family protein [Gemmataceae bacterium]|nr:acyl-CoA dehydrogenase family protein [Gemmataceae bacterium]
MNMPRLADSFDEILRSTHAIGVSVLRVHAADVDAKARFPRESIDALRQARLLSAYVPAELGGMGLSMFEITRICEALGQHCGSSAMIFAMHQIQVACLVHHAQESPFFRDYLRQLVAEQRLIASATTEVGVGGDLRSSIAAVEVSGDGYRLTKKAPVISYGEYADEILITCRKSPDAAASDQVQVLARRADCKFEPLSGWDTLGFRGTCSSGSVVTTEGRLERIVSTPFADILAQTMHPVSHLVWSSLWTGIAADAVNQARAFCRAEARKTPGETPISAVRLAEVDSILQSMRHNVVALGHEYQELLSAGDPSGFAGFGFAIRVNNLKVSSSQVIVDIVGKALLICGIAGYRNDSKYSLGRHLRDAYGAALMVNNDRIVKLNASMLLAHREG